MSQPEYGYSAKVSVDQFANSVNASNPGIYEIPLVHTDAKGRLWTTNQGSEEQLPMLDGVKLPPPQKKRHTEATPEAHLCSSPTKTGF